MYLYIRRAASADWLMEMVSWACMDITWRWWQDIWRQEISRQNINPWLRDDKLMNTIFALWKFTGPEKVWLIWVLCGYSVMVVYNNFGWETTTYTNTDPISSSKRVSSWCRTLHTVLAWTFHSRHCHKLCQRFQAVDWLYCIVKAHCVPGCSVVMVRSHTRISASHFCVKIFCKTWDLRQKWHYRIGSWRLLQVTARKLSLCTKKIKFSSSTSETCCSHSSTTNCSMFWVL